MLKFALIGNPLSHSIGSKVYAEIFEFLGLEAIYQHFEVEDEEFPRIIDYLRIENYKGFNITIPFKNKIIKHLDEIDKKAEEIGAVNNVKNNNNKLIGFNTDFIGIYQSLKKFGINKSHKACIIGAGGSARAALFAIKNIAENVFIVNRSYERAIELANKFKKFFSSIIVLSIHSKETKDAISDCDLIINCTPVGMYPFENSSPIEVSSIKSQATVVDLVYNPLMTKLLSYSKRIGCKVIDGLWIYVFQLIANLKIWLNVDIEAEIVRNVCERYLK